MTRTITKGFVSGTELTACLIHHCDLLSLVTESHPRCLPVQRALQPFPPAPALQLEARVPARKDTRLTEPETLNPGSSLC